MSTRRKEGLPGWFWGAAIAAGLLVAGGIAASQSGHPEADIPGRIVDQIDQIVASLNNRFGKTWVNRGIAALHSAMAAILPGPLLALLGAVYKVEEWAHHQRRTTGRIVSGYEKQCQAVRLCSAA